MLVINRRCLGNTMQKSRDKSVLRHFWKYQQHVKVAYGIPCILTIKPRGFTAIVERVLCSRSRPCPFLLLLTLPSFNVYRSDPIPFPAPFANAIRVLPLTNVR